MLHWCTNSLASKWLDYTSAFTRVLQRAPIVIFSFHSLLSVELHISTAASDSALLQSRKLTFYRGKLFPPLPQTLFCFSGQKRVASTKPMASDDNDTRCCPFVKLKEYTYWEYCSVKLEDHGLKLIYVMNVWRLFLRSFSERGRKSLPLLVRQSTPHRKIRKSDGNSGNSRPDQRLISSCLTCLNCPRAYESKIFQSRNSVTFPFI